MDDLVKEVIPLLQYLIPGFLSAWIFYSLTAFRRPDTFGQIVQALIFTFVIQGAVLGIGTLCLWVGSKGFSVGKWDARAEALWAFIVSVYLGGLSCYLASNGVLHASLRKRNLTRKNSHPSEWYSAFEGHDRLVTLHLSDERRLFGWPLEWPTGPSEGQFIVLNPHWLGDDGLALPFGAELLVIDSSKVQWVEFSSVKEDLL
ncbi:DUF6338 family protein [Pseudomonas sp. 29]|jgi:hypothetical protein|uniref:DUF6338 family protein n=1 Tax=Pseudomonas TaxID=286 RepID=UPI000C177E8A|nr:DUF6338 family protein [Pseudomonas sp. 29]PIF52631.1 hypothetical protein CLU80_5110 [Pseudomonas sp. 29]